MNLSLKQSQALDYCMNFFDTKLKGVEIECIVLYGSATYPGCFVDGMSDLDIMAISKTATTSKLMEVVLAVSNAMLDEKTWKPPTILRDHIGDRVEFELLHSDISIDCTIMENLICSQKDMLRDVVRDSAELLIGAMVVWGIPVRGMIRRYVLPDMELFPYYDETIRKERLSIIGQYLSSKIARLEFMLESDDVAMIDYFFRYRPVFLKWIFCYYRKYPINFYKHLPIQLSWIAELSPYNKSVILLDSGGTIIESIRLFINFFRMLLDEFYNAND